MHFYTKYKKALEAHGYRIDEHGCVWDERGNQAASEDRFGNVGCSDYNVTEICRKAQAEMDKPKPKPKPKKKAETRKNEPCYGRNFDFSEWRSCNAINWRLHRLS